MTRIALAAAALVATLGAPALAQDAQSFAIQHFNADVDGIDGLRMVRDQGADVTISSQNAPAVALVYAQLNNDIDGIDGLRGVTGQVVNYAGTPANGADIFEALRAASLEDE